MFALFHVVPYEGDSFLGVFSTLPLAQAAAHATVSIAESDLEGDCFYGHLEVRPVELDQGFRVGFLEPPLWTFK